MILDPALMLAIHMLPCEDGHAQERSLLLQVLPLVTAGDLWIADRNFCTVGFLYGIVQAGGFFILRQHGNSPIASSGEPRSCGRCSTGEVFDANEVRFNYGRMDVALDEEVWAPFQLMLASELAAKLKEYTSNVRLSAFKRHPRGPKKPALRRTKYANDPHVSTARLLARAGHKT